MAEKRMFTGRITNSDFFKDMPISAQALYFHLGMNADDEGFLNNARSVMRSISASDDDMDILIEKNFIILFESGVVVIKHWKMHNTIQPSRLKETQYTEERSLLAVKENNSYTLKIQSVDELPTNCQQTVGICCQTAAEIRLDKIRLEEDSLEEDIPDSDEPEPPAPKKTKSEKPAKHKYGEYKNVLLSDDELEKLKAEYPDYSERIERLSSYVASTGKSYKSHYATIRNWARKDAGKPGRKEIVPSWMKKNQFNSFAERPAENMDDLEAALLGAPKTAANDEEIRRRAQALKEQFGGA